MHYVLKLKNSPKNYFLIDRCLQVLQNSARVCLVHNDVIQHIPSPFNDPPKIGHFFFTKKRHSKNVKQKIGKNKVNLGSIIKKGRNMLDDIIM